MSAGKRNLLFALAAAVVVAGVVIAILSTGDGGHHRHPAGGPGTQAASRSPGAIELAAGYLHIPPEKLRDELRSGRSLEAIADATHGRSAAGLLHALVAARSAQLRARPAVAKLSAAARSRRLARLRRRLERQLQRFPGYIALGADARYLGLSVSGLRAQLSRGRSLAQIADATVGKSATGLIQTRVSAREASIEAAEKAGRVSKTSAAAALAALRRHITEEVERIPVK